MMLTFCSIWIPLLTLNDICFGLHAHPPFYSHTLLIPGNLSRMIFFGVVITTAGIDCLDSLDGLGVLDDLDDVLQLMCNITSVQG